MTSIAVARVTGPVVVHSARVEQEDFNEHERRFRESTVGVAKEFAAAVHETWLWTKKRMNLVFAEGVPVSRHNNDVKQKSYIESGSELVWEKSSQSVLGFVREFVPSVLEQVPDEPCPNDKCDATVKVFSNSRKIVVRAWEKFWDIKTEAMDLERLSRVQEMINLLRLSRQTFKLVPDPKSCYTPGVELHEQFKKENFLPELQSRLSGIWGHASERYLKAVIVGLPDMVTCKTQCLKCRTRVLP